MPTLPLLGGDEEGFVPLTAMRLLLFPQQPPSTHLPSHHFPKRNTLSPFP